MKTPSITLDAGHGGKDPGAVGLRGRREKDVALAVTSRLAVLLMNAGLRVVQTRMDDRFLELGERARIANGVGTDLFLSIHCNSAANRNASGFEVFTEPGQSEADGFATALFQEFAKAFPTKTKRMDTSDGDEDKEARFAVLRLTTMPAALFELDFISNATAEEWLGESRNQTLMAEALCDGVLKYLGMVKPTVAGPTVETGEPPVPLLLARLLPEMEETLERERALARRIEDLNDAELLELLAALAAHEEIHGAAGEVMRLGMVEATARWIRANRFQ